MLRGPRGGLAARTARLRASWRGLRRGVCALAPRARARSHFPRLRVLTPRARRDYTVTPEAREDPCALRPLTLKRGDEVSDAIGWGVKGGRSAPFFALDVYPPAHDLHSSRGGSCSLSSSAVRMAWSYGLDSEALDAMRPGAVSGMGSWSIVRFAWLMLRPQW